jgi:hypothetical protein
MPPVPSPAPVQYAPHFSQGATTLVLLLGLAFMLGSLLVMWRVDRARRGK